jgi:hypothetical protein
MMTVRVESHLEQNLCSGIALRTQFVTRMYTGVRIMYRDDAFHCLVCARVSVLR